MNYRTTRIYSRSLELIDFVAVALKKLPPGFAFLGDQIRRSSASVALNYVEGCGRRSVIERRRFFEIAIGSASEVAGTLEVMQRFGVLAEDERVQGQDICDHLVAMLKRFH